MFDVSPFSMAARKFCLWHQEETRRRLRGGRLEAFFRPPFLLAGTVERFKAGDEKLGRLQLRRNVECSHCACMAAARQEHSIEVGLILRYTMLSKWNRKDSRERVPSAAKRSGKLCAVKVSGCRRTWRTLRATLQFSGDVLAALANATQERLAHGCRMYKVSRGNLFKWAAGVRPARTKAVPLMSCGS